MCLSQRPPFEGHGVTRQRPVLVKVGRPARAGPSNRLKGLERTSMPGTFSKLPLRTDRNAPYSKMKSNSRLILKQPCNSASTAVWIMLQVVERSFAEKLRTSGWSAKLREIIPSYGQSLIENPALCERVRADTAAVLHINTIKETGQTRR